MSCVGEVHRRNTGGVDRELPCVSPSWQRVLYVMCGDSIFSKGCLDVGDDTRVSASEPLYFCESKKRV